MTSYVVMNCPLAGINGVHTDHQGNKEFIHSTGGKKVSSSRVSAAVSSPTVEKDTNFGTAFATPNDHAVTQRSSSDVHPAPPRDESTPSGPTSSEQTMADTHQAAEPFPLMPDAEETPTHGDTADRAPQEETAPSVPSVPLIPVVDAPQTPSHPEAAERPLNLPEPPPQYTRPIPALYNTHLPSDWRKVAVSTGWFGAQAQFEWINDRTGATRSQAPVDSGPNICSFTVQVGRQKLTAFAPTDALAELKKSVLQPAYIDGWENLAQFWTSTLHVYEHRIAVMQHYLRKIWERDAENHPGEKAQLLAEVDRLTTELTSLQEHERDLQRRYDTLLVRSGKSHTRRDSGHNGQLSFFPTGADIRNEFLAAFLNFESFACDAINCLEDMGVGGRDVTQLFVQQIMLPLFSKTKKFVRGRLDDKKALLKDLFGVEVPKEDAVNDESVPRLFWYQTQQPQFPAEIAALADEQILELMQSADPLVMDLHNQMMKASEEGIIDAGEQNLRIPQIVRHLLRMHTVAALSDPLCYLYPAPGVTVPYQDGVHAEILSPGVRRYGKIKEGEQVEVVLPGLYFDPPESGQRPSIPCVVRRTLAEACSSSAAGQPEDTGADAPQQQAPDWEQECALLTLQLSQAAARKAATLRRGELQQQYDAAVTASAASPGAHSFLAAADLGTALQDHDAEAATLPLSEEDYLTLADRRAAFLSKLKGKCEDLLAVKAYRDLRVFADRLRALEGQDATVAVLPTGCTRAPRSAPPITLPPGLQHYPTVEAAVAALEAQCVALGEQLAQAPARAEAIRNKEALARKMSDALAANAFYDVIADIGIELETYDSESSQLPLSEEAYLTLPGRRAALVQSVHALCQHLLGRGQFATVKRLAAALEPLEEGDNDPVPVPASGQKAATGDAADASHGTPTGAPELVNPVEHVVTVTVPDFIDDPVLPASDLASADVHA